MKEKDFLGIDNTNTKQIAGICIFFTLGYSFKSSV